MKRLHLAFAFIPLCLMAMTPSQPLQWYKGNTHTHTINSDGDSTPDEVVRWYRERDYHFLVLSDHNFLTEVEGLNSLFAAQEQFLIINGEEVTDNFGESRIHVNGLNLREVVPPQGGSNAVDTLQRNVDAIRSVGGVPHINHPNFRWSLTADQMRQVRNNKLFEIYNGSPSVNNHGGGGSPGLEAMWDNILSSGKLIYGIAVDDAHHFKGEFSPDRLNPGAAGWWSGLPGSRQRPSWRAWRPAASTRPPAFPCRTCRSTTRGSRSPSSRNRPSSTRPILSVTAVACSARLTG